MPKDLRSYINALTQNYPGQLVDIEKAINPAEFEINAVLESLARRNMHPAVLFQDVKALNGARWPGRLVTNIDPGTFFRAAVAVGLDPYSATSQQVVDALSAGMTKPIKSQVIDRSAAPIKENVFTGDQVNVSMLPLIMHYEKDTRPGWFTPIVAMPHPVTGRYNLSYHRTLFKDPRTMITAMRTRHPAEYLKAASDNGGYLPVAMVVGHHPGFYQGAAMRAHWDLDEYEVIGGTLGEPLRLVASETFGDKLLVPADAEVVVEGKVYPDRMDLEAPFGEWSRYYGPQTYGPTVEITAITHRRNAIFQAVRTSYHIIEDIAHSAGLLGHLKSRYPRVVAACSLFHTWAIISYDKQFEGEPFRLASYALGYGDHVKHVVVVDKDIDPFNLRSVLWAMGVRMQPHLGIQVLKDLNANSLDPSTVELKKGSVTLIDATTPVNRPFQKMVSVPDQTQRRIDAELEAYIPRDQLLKIPKSDPWQI